ncbi:DUF4835 family protein [Hymenobacter fastidiosus]|uniref:DUF4835 family protein n=1 Tax=Hymenobacter fastidiosus TaxID=486264 RepID=A0ABP7SYW3_9BACT
MRKILIPLLLLFILLAHPGRAQELNVQVQVTAENVAITDRQLIQQMSSGIQNFLNTRPFTRLTFRPDERINCRLFIGINKIPENGLYEATARIVTTRPVYGTGYETNILSFVDKNWVFRYDPQVPVIDYSENAFVGNLSSLLSFYAYLIIGMDQDSFSRLGGSPYYDQARNILNNAASQSVTSESDNGWKDAESNNRYWLLNNLQDPQLEALRSGSYAYYRQGLDVFIEKPVEARTSIFSALQGVQQAAVRRPGTLLARSFFTAKSQEITDIFRTTQDAQQKQQIVTMMSEVDPTNSAKYQALLK